MGAFSIVFMALAFSAQFVRAADACPAMRLDQGGGVFEKKIPVYNQGGVPSCFAHSASELIDAYRFGVLKDKSSHLTSPHHIFLQQNSGSTTYHGGVVKDAIDISKIYGSCDYRTVFKDLHGEKFDSLISVNPSLKKMHEFWTSIPKEWKTANRGKTDAELKTAVKPYLDELRCLEERLEFPVPDLEKYSGVFTASLLQDSKADFFHKLLNGVCEEKKAIKPLKDIIPEPLVMELGIAQQSFTKEKGFIARALTQGQPIAVDFCSDWLDKSAPLSGFMGKSVDAKQCSVFHHSAVVIGQEPFTVVAGGKTLTRCRFLMRNSWGLGCDHYKDAARKKDCQSAGRGNVWVDSEEMMYNSLRLTGLVGR